MEKTTIELTTEDINNLIVFMERTELKGNEVPAYNSIVFKLHEKVKELKATN
jgi:hypothetical protein